MPTHFDSSPRDSDPPLLYSWIRQELPELTRGNPDPRVHCLARPGVSYSRIVSNAAPGDGREGSEPNSPNRDFNVKPTQVPLRPADLVSPPRTSDEGNFKQRRPEPKYGETAADLARSGMARRTQFGCPPNAEPSTAQEPLSPPSMHHNKARRSRNKGLMCVSSDTGQDKPRGVNPRVRPPFSSENRVTTPTGGIVADPLMKSPRTDPVAAQDAVAKWPSVWGKKPRQRKKNSRESGTGAAALSRNSMPSEQSDEVGRATPQAHSELLGGATAASEDVQVSVLPQIVPTGANPDPCPSDTRPSLAADHPRPVTNPDSTPRPCAGACSSRVVVDQQCQEPGDDSGVDRQVSAHRDDDGLSGNFNLHRCVRNRCQLFYPAKDCADGSSCQRNKSLFVHPVEKVAAECSFDGDCACTHCKFTHTNRRHTRGKPETYILVPCTEPCPGITCAKLHPGDTLPHAMTWCFFGDRCNRPPCPYFHSSSFRRNLPRRELSPSHLVAIFQNLMGDDD